MTFCAMLVAAPAFAGCAGLSTGAIAGKFSEAMHACGGAPDLHTAKLAVATSAATPLASAEPIVVVPQAATAFATPATVHVPYSISRRPAARSGSRRGSNDLLTRVSTRYRIDPLLLGSIVRQESGGRIGAVSNKGALGLMQVMPATARSLGVADPHRMLGDPELSLITGATYLKQLQGHFGNDVPKVLAAYNAGPGAVRRYGRAVPYAETRGYVSTIMTRYRTARGETPRRVLR